MKLITDCTALVIPDDVHPTLVIEGPGPHPFNPGEIVEGTLAWWSNGIVTVGTILDDHDPAP